MRFSLVHLPDDRVSSEDTEVAVVVPGAERTALLVPLNALADFLPLLHEATQSLGVQRCPTCHARLPGLDEPEVDVA